MEQKRKQICYRGVEASGSAWHYANDMDEIITAGHYSVCLSHDNLASMGIVTAPCDAEHKVVVQLIVTESAIANKQQHGRVVGQTLVFAACDGATVEILNRTAEKLENGFAWQQWNRMSQKIEVGEVTSLDDCTESGTYNGVFTNGQNKHETFIMVVINNAPVAEASGKVRCISQFKYALGTDSNFSYKTRTGRGDDDIEWGDWVDLGAATTTDIQDGAITAQKLSNDVREKVEKIPSLEQNAAKEKTALVNGDVIVGLAREVYSRQGKTDTATFLKRTTAGGTSIGDGVATLKQVGGNIVNNKILDKPFASGSVNYTSEAVTNFICTGGVGSLSFTGYQTANNYEIPSHIYYVSAFVKAQGTGKLNFSYTNSNGSGESAFTLEIPLNGKWERVSRRYKSTTSSSPYYRACSFGCPNTDSDVTAQIYSVLYIDLTEMYGAGNEPTKDECDRLFGAMDALSQGMSIANPKIFKSTGFNQFNPDNVLVDKAVVDGAIVDGDKTLAIIPCLPCKVGVGDNNGYCIHGDFGDNIKVYFTPLNPMEVEGALYMHELALSEKGSYVPQIKGYMIVEVPTVANLCAHLLWSEDCDREAYEPYYESVVELPAIPEMSGWGLAGISVGGTAVQDIIDLENKRYKKSIGCFDLGSKVGGMVGNIYHISIPDAAKSIAGVVPNLLCATYKTVLRNNMETHRLNTISQNDNSSTITLYDSSCTTAEEYAAKLKGVVLYYELAEPIEYPLPKVTNNYTCSDYGVEEFDDGVPCNANNLYYMRSLAGETRNFLDRLMDRLGASDVTVAADRIIAAIQSHDVVEETSSTE